MIEILAYVAVASVIGGVALLAYASTRPDTFSVARTASIDAPPERIFPLINDLRAMNTWNPFVLNDPHLKGDYSGSPSGAGAAYAFEGGRSGTGRIEITGASPPAKVAMNLVMLKPMKAENSIEFTLAPKGASTNVTWAMTGHLPLAGKVAHLFMDMGKVCGKAFEDGLAKLKVMAEERG